MNPYLGFHDKGMQVSVATSRCRNTELRDHEKSPTASSRCQSIAFLQKTAGSVRLKVR